MLSIISRKQVKLSDQKMGTITITWWEIMAQTRIKMEKEKQQKKTACINFSLMKILQGPHAPKLSTSFPLKPGFWGLKYTENTATKCRHNSYSEFWPQNSFPGVRNESYVNFKWLGSGYSGTCIMTSLYETEISNKMFQRWLKPGNKLKCTIRKKKHKQTIIQ